MCWRVSFRSNRNERSAQMEHYHHSGLDEFNVSKHLVETFWVEMHQHPLSFSLLILTLMNVGLFFKLWAMEDITHRMYMSTKHRLRERAEARSEKLLLRDNCSNLCGCMEGRTRSITLFLCPVLTAWFLNMVLGRLQAPPERTHSCSEQYCRTPLTF